MIMKMLMSYLRAFLVTADAQATAAKQKELDGEADGMMCGIALQDAAAGAPKILGAHHAAVNQPPKRRTSRTSETCSRILTSTPWAPATRRSPSWASMTRLVGCRGGAPAPDHTVRQLDEIDAFGSYEILSIPQIKVKLTTERVPCFRPRTAATPIEVCQPRLQRERENDVTHPGTDGLVGCYGRDAGRSRVERSNAMQGGVLVVTGGSRGIGAAVVRRAAYAGWSVCFSYQTNAAGAGAVAEDVERCGVEVRPVQADMGAEADIVSLFANAAELGPVTGLVANAGIVAKQRRIVELDADRIRRLLEVNVVAPLLCCREAVLRMSTRYQGHGGSIVLVSSAASRLGSPGEYVDYAASKGAVDTLGLGLAKEVATAAIPRARLA